MSARTQDIQATTVAAEQKRRLQRTCLANAVVLAMLASAANAATYNAASEAELIQAINSANASAGADTIRISKDIALSAALPAITDTLTLLGVGGRRAIARDDSGSNACGPSATNAFRLIDASADLSLVNLTLSGGCNLADQGGAVRVQGAALRVERSVVTGNQTFVENPNYYYYQGGVGGGIAVLYGNLTLVDSTLSNNATHGNFSGGGGAVVYAGDLRVVRSTISGNRTNGFLPFGGGINAVGDLAHDMPRTVTIVDSVFTGNSASGSYVYGGGLAAYAQATSISNSQFIGNSAGGSDYARGAGADIENPHRATTMISIDHCTISGNSIDAYSGWGAGLRLTGGVVSVNASTVAGNSIDAVNRARGGAMWIEVANATITNTTVSDNHIGGSNVGGGGVAILSEAPELMTLAVYNSTIAGNQANGGTGGGLWMKMETADSVPPTVSLESTILAGNEGSAGLDDIGYSSTAPVVAAAHSLIQGSVDVGAGTFTPDATTVALTGLDPLLLPLANNGGTTQTRALGCGSAAINAGSNVTGLNWDQRGNGFPRKTGQNVDIGAVEARCQ